MMNCPHMLSHLVFPSFEASPLAPPSFWFPGAGTAVLRAEVLDRSPCMHILVVPFEVSLTAEGEGVVIAGRVQASEFARKGYLADYRVGRARW
jgi:hypothetical protein